MTQTLHINYREMERAKILTRIVKHDLTVIEGAEALGISERQMYRVLCRYRIEGDAGLMHQLRGRTSNKALPQGERTKAIRLYREQYDDYGPTLFVEKLDVYHGLRVSRQTATRWLINASLWSGSRKKRPHRKKRMPRAAIGSLIQFDGSHHAWFEDRGPACCLLVAIDDASNQVLLQFAPTEDTHHVLTFWRDYIHRFGIPAEAYTDRGAVYVDAEKPEQLTQFGRALAALNIRHIKAHSPQAKGRVERANRTLQDRLLRALREQNISCIKDANRFLAEQFTAQHNRQFAHLDNLTNVHRAADGVELQNIFCIEEQRSVNHDWTIAVHAQCIQLLRSTTPLPPPRAKVLVRFHLDGSLHIFWNEHELAYEQLSCRPKRSRRAPKPPAANHPWRMKPIGGIAAMRRAENTLALKKNETYHAKEATKQSSSRRKDSVRYALSVFPSTKVPP